MNKQDSNPSNLARETLKMLATRKIPPTPDNYARIYAEISGIPEENSGAAMVLSGLAERLSQNPKSIAAGTALKKLIGTQNWDRCLGEIEKILPKQSAEISQSWAKLIRDLLHQLDTAHKGLTVTRKKEGVEIVLTRFATNPEALFDKLTGLMRSWSDSTTIAGNNVEIDPVPPANPADAKTAITKTAPVPPQKLAGNTELIGQLSELLAQTLLSLLSTQPELTGEVNNLVQQVRSSNTHEQIIALTKLLRPFWIKVELHGGDKAKVHEGLVRLLRLLVENIGEMVEDEEWVHGQVISLQEIIANPMSRGVIADAERSLRDTIIKQGLLKQSLTDAKSTLKSLMVTFVDRLGEITESTGDYHQKIEGYSVKIGQSKNISELSLLLDDIMQDTRLIRDNAQRSHQELLGSRKQVQEAENKIKQLEQELEQVSELVHEDQLTGALNRRGLDEAFDREASRADRNQSPMCIAMLDMDDFKRLNDTHGHKAGDQALIHLSGIIKDTLRPSDSVTRYGGEEFVLLLPDIELDAAIKSVERLQRELTKKFFLHENERILVTFSAGVALRNPEESQADVLSRADKAMYTAKQAGKNRVVAARQ
ncbi:MAG: GGDEF domain-containing protein [Gallionella sp.]